MDSSSKINLSQPESMVHPLIEWNMWNIQRNPVRIRTASEQCVCVQQYGVQVKGSQSKDQTETRWKTRLRWRGKRPVRIIFLWKRVQKRKKNQKNTIRGSLYPSDADWYAIQFVRDVTQTLFRVGIGKRWLVNVQKQLSLDQKKRICSVFVQRLIRNKKKREVKLEVTTRTSGR